MKRPLTIALAAPLTYLALTGVAAAGTITASGDVTALDDISQLPSIVGSALFDEEFQGEIPLDQYAAAGLTLNTGELGMILPGVMEVGEVGPPMYTAPGVHFPYPIAGGGVQYGNIILSGGAATFADPITQFGLTAGGSGPLYITVWDQMGVMIGQVAWVPEDGEAAFVGVDTMGVPIGLLTVGNDDIFAGEEYDVLGAAARSDSWIWGLGAPCLNEDDCFDDTWSCTARACVDSACSYSFTTEPCDDGNACTDTDICAEGLCAGVEIDCADTNVCTFDSCDPSSGCSNNPIEGCCLSDEDCPEEGSTCIISSNTCTEPPPPPPPPPPDETGDTGAGDGGDTGTGETGAAAEDGGGGCGCTTEERGGGALLGLLGLVLLGGVQRRRHSSRAG
jgi:MYXO-CTERM domain-containing protein